MSFIERAVEIVENGVEAAGDAASEYAEHRHAAKLFLKLGIAAYAEQRLGGTHEPVERILQALDGHAAEYGEVDLDHLKAAHEVLGDAFVSAHSSAD
ncbi:hypothetical protein [Streptacidiphilus rugosus]|uniref:hypothetical protein n=1 Tax=Streptacidiphilus rugosus TaxID=405783 RepID=UPI000562A358|nr:hypothetical protein [Streptacidiphilus rugosus]